MTKEKFLLVNLKEDQTKKLAQAIQNDSCREILDFLADKEGTESDIAKQLSQPLSTVHYNLQLLMKAGLVKVEEYHYSPKGREVNHYKLANQFIIIAPQSSSAFNLKERLKSLLPAGLIAIMGGALFQLYHSFSGGIFAISKASAPMLRTMDAVDASVGEGIRAKSSEIASDIAVQTAGNGLADSASNLTQGVAAVASPDNVAGAGRAMMKTVAENATGLMNNAAPAAFAQDQSSNLTQEIVNSAANNYDSFAQSIPTAIQPHEPNYFMLISIGVIATIVLVLIIQYIQYRRRN
jgi:DNA-binding transcriptional ArsR family regulator